MRNNITDTVISLWTSALDLPKITKRNKLTVETHESRKVMVVRTIYDAHIPPANEETRQSLLKSQSTGRLRDVPTSTQGREITTMRLSRSETSLHRMALQRGTSKEMFSSRRIGHSKLETDSLNKHANDRQFKQLDIVSELLPATENNATLNNAVSAVSPSLEIPFLDPNFDIEDILREAETEVEMGNLSETSVSTSSSPEMWEEAPRSCSSASSNSTLRSGFDKEISSSETKPLTTPSGPERRKADRPPERTSPEPKTKPVTFSQETRRRKEQYLKQKPLPAIPMTLSIVTNQNAKHIAALASRYSPSRSESPIDRFLVLKETDKTLSQAANDLERELEKTADVHPARRSEQSISEHTTVENAVDSLNVSPKREGSVTKALRTHQKESVATRKQHQTYRVFPPPGKSNPTKKNNIVQQNQSITESSAGGIKQHIQTSQSSRSVSHKIKSSVQLPGLRRTRLNNQTAHPTRHQQNKPPTLSTKSPIESLRDEQAALAKSTDRYIDAEIAKALNVEYDEEEEDDVSIDSKDIEGEWSTMYPLKAVKKLGIPLLTNSHIPRLSSSETERSLLQQQSPKIDTKSIQILSPLSAPDDISMRVRSFIADSAFFQSPTEEKQLISTDEKLGSDKVFICLGRMETVPEDTPLKTDKVPLMMGIRTAPQPLAATYPPRNQSLCELDGTTQLLSPNPLKMLHQMPDDVVLALMWNVDNLDGLFKYAQVNRQFYRVFKDNELPLIKNALFKMNPPAWELREMSPPWSDISNGLKDPDAPVPGYNASSYLQHYARDVFAIVRLKALIYATCSTIVRSDTIGGLTGEDDVRASEIDEAFWRVWTFCRIFGCGKNREGDIHGQIDWLNGGYLAKRSKSGATVITAEPFFSMNNVLFDPPAGFGDGNGDGLTCNQLYDMLEIWNCLGTLVQGFHRECKEARVAGIFDGLDIPVGDITKEEAMLEEWTHYLLTLGPSALVSLSSVTASYSAEEVFAKANQMGLTKWEAPEDGGTRSSFLREAISRAYDSRVTIQQKLSNFPVSHNEGSVHSVAAGSDGTRDLSHNTTSNSQPGHSLWTDGDDPSSYRSPPYTSVNHDSTFTTPLLSPPPRYSVTDSNFIDPVDRAIHRMVHELGFSERDATWALKITDTGDMLDINAAIQLLVRERRKRARFKLFYNPACSMASGRDECLVDVSRHRGTVGWRWA